MMLGEATHEDGATMRAKSRLVRFLHERLRYSVLAFEAPLYDAEMADKALHQYWLPVDQALAVGLFGNAWRADEILDLFEYVRTTYATPHPLRLVGFDPALLDPRAYLIWLEATVARLAPATIDRQLAFRLAVAVERFPKVQKFRQLSVNERAADRGAFERVLAGIEQANANALPARKTELEWSAQTVRGVLALYDWHAAVHADVSPTIDWNAHPDANNVRDAAMAKNLLWLINTQHKSEKVIVWAATFHVARNLKDVEPRFAALRSMGEQVASVLGTTTFVIGTTARTGAIDEKESLPPPHAESWESVSARLCPSSCLVDLTTPGMPSTLRTLRARAVGFTELATDWSRVVDGLLILDRAQPAKLIR